MAKLDLHYDTSVNPSRLPTEQATKRWKAPRPRTPKFARFGLPGAACATSEPVAAQFFSTTRTVLRRIPVDDHGDARVRLNVAIHGCKSNLLLLARRKAQNPAPTVNGSLPSPKPAIAFNRIGLKEARRNYFRSPLCLKSRYSGAEKERRAFDVTGNNSDIPLKRNSFFQYVTSH
jgi:hypothetical protein